MKRIVMIVLLGLMATQAHAGWLDGLKEALGFEKKVTSVTEPVIEGALPTTSFTVELPPSRSDAGVQHPEGFLRWSRETSGLYMAEGVAIDSSTGLMWMRCAIGQTWTGTTCQGKADKFTWPQAKLVRSSQAGYSDWRLPTIAELQSLVEQVQTIPSIDSMAFPNTPAFFFWTASPYVGNSSFAWVVHFSDGGAYNYDRSYGNHVRLVRGGQTLQLLSSDNALTAGQLKKLTAIRKWSYGNGVGDFSIRLNDKIRSLETAHQALPHRLLALHAVLAQPPQLPRALSKDEFETSSAFNARVAKVKADYEVQVADYNLRVADYERQVKAYYAQLGPVPEAQRQQAIREAFFEAYGAPAMSNLRYDADTQSFYSEIAAVGINELKKSLVLRDIPPDRARRLKPELEKAKPEVIFRINPDNSLTWESINLQVGNDKLAALPVDTAGQPQKIEVAIKPVEMATPRIDLPQPILTQKIDVAIKDDPVIAARQAEIDRIRRDKARSTAREAELKRLEDELARLKASSPAGFQDDLPERLAKRPQAPANPRLHVLAVGIEDYADVADVPFASRSARQFAAVAERVLGVPSQNVLVLTNDEATGTRMKGRLNTLLNRLGPADSLLVYYAGHGVPDPTGKAAYLLPQDAGPGSFEDSQLRLDAFYRKLADSKAGRVSVFMDACFTGRADSTRMVFEGVAPVMLTPTSVVPESSRLTVMTATGKQQFANQAKDVGHRLFGYHLMRGLMDGKTDIADLARYVEEQVQTDSRRLGPEFEQRPELMGRATGRLVDR